MGEPLVSVVIPCRNAARFLPQAMRSLLWQTLPDWECLLVDDGSTDGSVETYRERAAGDPRFRSEHQRNQGASAARNLGVAAARGRFVQFLDADDVLLPRKLERSVERLRTDPAPGAVYSDYICLDARGEFFKLLPGRIPGEDVPLQFLLDLNRTFVVPIHAFTFRREVVAAHPFDVALHSYGEDMDCWIRIAASGARFEFVPDVLVVYRLRPDSLASNETRMMRAKLSVLEKYAGEPWARPHAGALRGARSYYRERLAIGHFQERSFGEGWRILERQWPDSGWSARLKMLSWLLLLLALPRRAALSLRAWLVERLGVRPWGWSRFQRWEPPAEVRDLLLPTGRGPA